MSSWTTQKTANTTSGCRKHWLTLLHTQIQMEGQMLLEKIGRVMNVPCALLGAWMFIQLHPGLSMAAPNRSPQPDPPFIDSKESGGTGSSAMLHAPLSVREWTFHKSTDNLHPDGSEQQFIWLMNRARANPSHEGYWLANTGIFEIANALVYWNVNLTVLQNEFNGYDQKPPAAFDVRLYEAAKAHSDDLIRRDAQDHNGQFQKLEASDFYCTAARGNVFSYTTNALYGHVAFNVDWGNDNGDGSGMQSDRGHRMAVMSIDDDYTNVGLAAVVESNPVTGVGPLVVTGNFCKADAGYADHYNRFLVGTVWQDANNNDQYDPGEGMTHITVMPDSGTYYAVTANSGGYAFPIESAGELGITFSGSGIFTPVTRSIVVNNTHSTLLDLKYTAGSSTPVAVTKAASGITSTAANLEGIVYTQGRDTQYFFQYGTTTNYGNATDPDTVSADSAVTAVLTGLTPNTRYHYRLVATQGAGTHYGTDQTLQTMGAWATDSTTPGAPGSDSSGGGGCFIVTAGTP
jgi:hypothetical protein